MSEPFDCLICCKPIREEVATNEHVIPNAIGGHIKTRNATCIGCNNKAGDGIDGQLTKALSLLANIFDVPRQEGEHQDIVAVDSISGLEYIKQAGQKPVLGDNTKIISVESVKENTGKRSVLKANTFAPTREEAERNIRKKASLDKQSKGKKKIVEKMELTPTVREGEPFSFSFDVFVADKDSLRAIAKIGLCYARSQGYPVSSSCIAAQFVQGKDTRITPVAPIHTDVIKFNEPIANPFFHGIVLCKPFNQRRLFAYVTLFQVCEFVVLLDDDCLLPGFMNGYLWNIVSAREEPHEIEWITSADEIMQWIENFQLPVRYNPKSMSSLQFWLQNLPLLKEGRAVGQALKMFEECFKKCIEAGMSEEEATLKAKENADEVLSEYGLSMGDITVTRQ